MIVRLQISLTSWIVPPDRTPSHREFPLAAGTIVHLAARAGAEALRPVPA